MLINKRDFIEIINRLQNYDQLQNEINDLFKGLLDNREQDFCNAGSICIGHESVVVKLLEKMFETDLISWWIYELDYGKKYKKGDLVYDNKNIDVSTVDKLYDVLIEDLKRERDRENE